MFESLLKRPFWQSLFTGATGSGRTKYTFEELRALSDVLNKNQVVTEANKAVVVETIRSIAEFMIWGDQNEPRIFEYFMENNVMHYLHRVLQQPANRSGDVAKQVLQTLSIIIQNVRSENGTYFLFSNNHINNIVEIRFDFDDEEVLGYYISFLKTISLKLNAGTVQFFFDRRESAYTFPLYSEAVKFAHHKEGMVRAGVRTLTLNVYSVPDPYIQDYVCRPPAISYLADMVSYIADQVKILDKRMASAEGFSAQVLSSLDSQLAEVEDMVSYVADILTTAHPRFAHLTAQHLWVALIGPFLLRPLLEYGTTKAGQAPQGSRRTSGGGGAHASPGPAVRAACSLYCLERLFVLITYPPLLNNLALALLDPRVGHPSCKSALVSLLRSEDHRAVPAALRCLVAMVHNRHVAPEVLALLGMVPRSRAADLHTACGAGDCAACRLRDQLSPLPEGCPAAGLSPDPLAEEPQPVATAVAGPSGVGLHGGGAGVGVPVFGYHVVWTRMEGPSQASPDRQDYGGGYPAGDDTGVDASYSSFSEAGGAGLTATRQLPECDEEEREEEASGSGQEVSQAKGQSSSQADLLGIGMDGPGTEAPGTGPGATSAAAAEAGPGPSASVRDSGLPAVLEVSLDTPLLVDYAASEAPLVTGASAESSARADSLPGPSALEPQPQQPSLQSHESGVQEVDLLGVETVAEPASAPGASPRAAGATSIPDLLDAPSYGSSVSVPAEESATSGPGAARVPEAGGGDLLDLLTGQAPAAEQAAAPAPQAGPADAVAAQLSALAPLSAADSTPSLNAAASGSLLDSLLEPAASGASAVSGASGVARQASTEPSPSTEPSSSAGEPVTAAQVQAQPVAIPDLVDAPLDAAPAAAAGQGQAAGGAQEAELLGITEVEVGPAVLLGTSSAEPAAGAGVRAGSVADQVLDLLDAQLQPMASSEEAAPAAGAEPPSPAGPGVPLGDLLGTSTLETGADGATAPAAASKPQDPLADLLGPSAPQAASGVGGAEAAPSNATDTGSEGTAGHADVATSSSSGATAEPEVPLHQSRSVEVDLLGTELEAPTAAVPPPPPPPPAPPLPPPAAPPPAPVAPALPPCPAHARPAAVAASPDILDALFALLSMQLLPVAGLWNVVLLLGQLYPRVEEQRELRRQLEALQALQQQPQLPVSSSGPGVADQSADLLGVGDDAGPAGQEPQLSSSGSGAAAAAAAAQAGGDPSAAAGALQQEQEREPDQQPHPLDPSSTVGWACELSSSQREALRVAAVSASSAVLDEVGGMWCDALVAMLALEWPTAHDAVARPVLRTGAEQLLAGPHLYPRQHARALSGASRNDQGLSGSAVAALHSYHAVARLVALLLLHDLLRKGAVSRQPPATCPMPAGADVEGRDMDVLEGQEVELQAGLAIPCIVSFSPGQERRVYFAAAGPALRRLTDYLHNAQALLGDSAAQAIVLHSSPAVVLADPAPTRLNAGIVLSVSPLLGCDPSVDKNVPKWLHVHVRPSVRGMLRLLRSAAAGRKGGLLGAMRHLVDGHWVLAFPDAERAANARQLVEQSAHRLRALYCELLSPLLSTVME